MKFALPILGIILMSASIAYCDPASGNGQDDPDVKPRSGQKARQTRSKNGRYRASITGRYRGTGVANVDGERITILAEVVTSDGVKGQFKADGLKLDGPYFKGAGTAAGRVVNVHGRLDAAKGSRLVADYTGGDGEFGRIVAILPEDAGDENWKKSKD